MKIIYTLICDCRIASNCIEQFYTSSQVKHPQKYDLMLLKIFLIRKTHYLQMWWGNATKKSCHLEKNWQIIADFVRSEEIFYQGRFFDSNK